MRKKKEQILEDANLSEPEDKNEGNDSTSSHKRS